MTMTIGIIFMSYPNLKLKSSNLWLTFALNFTYTYTTESKSAYFES